MLDINSLVEAMAFDVKIYLLIFFIKSDIVGKRNETEEVSLTFFHQIDGPQNELLVKVMIILSCEFASILCMFLGLIY